MGLKHFFISACIAVSALQPLHAEISSKTNKYLSILIKRPSSDYLFDKFYSSWLEEASGADLEKYLNKKFEETKNPVFKQLKAYYYEIEGNNELALDIYNDVISSDSSASLLYRRGALEVHTLEFEKAIADLKAALNQNPSKKLAIQINKLLGRIYIRDDKEEEGLKVWLEMAKAFNDEDLKEEIIELMVDEGLFDEARKQILDLIKQTSNKHKKITLTLRLGDIYRIQGNKDDALKKYSETLDNIGTGSWLEKEVLSQIEQVFRSEDNIQGLSEYYTKIIKEKKNNIEILKRQAGLLFELGEKDKSLEAYLQIVKLTPLKKENKETYAERLTKSKKYEEALEVISELIKQYPDDQELYISSAKLNSLIEKPENSVKDLQTYIKKDKESEYSFMRAANLLRSYKLKKYAAKIYDQLVAKYPDSREGKLLRALNLYQLDQKEKALNEYKTLGNTKNVAEIQRLAITLNTLKESSVTFEILKEQQENFKKSFKFNELLYNAATSSKDNKFASIAAQKMLDSSLTIQEVSKAASNIIYSSRKNNNLNETMERLEGKSDKNVNEKILLSEIYDSLEQIDASMEVIDKGIAQAPKNELLYEQKLRLCKKNREWDQAISTLTDLLKMTTKRKTAKLKELVELSLKAGQTEKALEWIAKWKKASQSSTEPHIHEAAIYRNDQNFTKSAEVLKKAMFKFPDNKTLPVLLAQDLGQSGKSKEASGVYWRLIGKTEDLSEKLGHMRSIITLAQQEDSTEELAQKLHSRMKNNPKSVFPPLALAELSRQSGSYEDRRKYLIRATELKSNDISLLAEIARIEEEEGQYDRVLETLKKIKSLDKSQKYSYLLPQFFMRSGEEERAFELIIENAGGINMPVEDVIKTTVTLLNSHSSRTIEFLKPFVLKHAEDYRVKFLYAVALEEASMNEEAVNAYINVLTSNKEVTALKKNQPQNPNLLNRSNYLKQLNKLLPPEAVQLIAAGYKLHSIYSYKRNNQFGSFRGFGLMNNAKLFPMPEKLAEINEYVIPHLATLYETIQEESQKKLISKLEFAGVKYPDLKMVLFNPQNRSMRSLEFWKKYQDKYKGDKTFDAIFAYMVSMQLQTVEELDENFEDVKNTNELLAFSMVASASSRNIEIKEEYLDFCSTYIKKDNLDDYISSYLAMILSSDKVPEKFIAPFKKKMFKLYFQSTDINQGWGPYQIVQSMLKIKDYESFVKILNHEVQNFQQNPKNNPYRNYYNRYGSNQQKLIIPLQFPPQSIKSLPPFVVQVFNRQGFSYNQGGQIEKEQLAKQISKINSPLLKLIVADYCDQDGVTSKVIDSYQSQTGKSLEKHLILAAWYGMSEKYTEAIEVLNKAKKLCSKKSEMKSVNAAIVYYAENSEDAKLKEDGKKAGEKLISLRLSVSEKGELASSLESMGFSKLATALDNEIDKAASRKTPITSLSNFSGRSQKKPSQKVRDLFNQGKDKDAVSLAAREFRKIAKTALNVNQQNMANSPWELNNIIRQIKEKRKIDDFIKLLEPGSEDTYSRKLLERALAYELLKESEKAINDYKAALKKNDSNKVAHLRLAFLIASDDITAAKNHLQKATGTNINFVGPIISSIINNMYNNVKVYDVYPLIIEIMKDVKPQMNQQFYWLTNIIQQMENNSYSSGLRLPNLFDTNQSVEGSKDKEKAKEILAKRDKNWVEMCKLALRFHSTSAMAFSKLEYFISIGRMQQPEDIFTLAKESLKTTSKSGYFTNHHMRIYANNIQIQPKSPEAIYIKTVLEKNLVEEEKDFFKELGSAGTRLKAKIDKIKKLYDCSEEEFHSLAETFVSENKNDFQMNALSTVIDAHQSRKLKTSLSDLVLGQFKNDLKTANSNQNSSYLSDWTKVLLQSEQKEFKTFVNKFFTILKEKIQDMKKRSKNLQNSPERYFVSNSIQNVFSPCISSGLKFTLTLLDSMTKAQLLEENDLFRSSNLSYTISNHFRKSSGLYEELRDSSLFAELEQFSPIPLPSSHRQSSALKEFYSQARSIKNKKDILSKLKAEKEQTFGIKFFTALLNASTAQDVYTYLDSYVEKFKTLPREKQSVFLESLSELMKESAFRNSSMGASGPFKDFESSFYSSSSGDRIAQFLKEDVGQNSYQYTQKASTLINLVVQTDVEQATNIYNEALKKLKKHYLRQRNSYSSSESPSEALFNKIRYDNSKSINKFKFLQAILPTVKFNRQRSHIFNFKESITSMLGEIISASRKNYRSNQKTKNEANFLAIRDFLKGDSVKGIKASYGSILVNALSSCSSKELTQLSNYLSKQNNNDEELTLLIKFYQSRQKDKKAKAPLKLLQLYNKKLSDDSLSSTVRLQVLSPGFIVKLLSGAESPEANKLLYKVSELSTNKASSVDNPYLINELIKSMLFVETKDEVWKSAARKLTSIADKVYRKNSEHYRCHDNYYNAAGLTYVGLLAHTDQLSKVKLLCKNTHLRLQKRFETYLILVTAGQKEYAAELLKQNITSLDKSRPYWSDVKKLNPAEQMKSFISHLNKELAFFVKVYTAYVTSNHTELEKLATSFEKEGPKNKELRRAIIETFNYNSKTKKLIDKFNSELFSSLDPMEAIYSRNTSTIKSYCNYLLAKIDSTSIEDLKGVLDKINKAIEDDKYDYYVKNISRNFSTVIYESLSNKSIKAQFYKKNMPKLILLGKGLLKNIDRAEDARTLFATTYLLINHSEGQDALNSWLNKFSDEYFKNLSTYYFEKATAILNKIHTDEKGKVLKGEAFVAKQNILTSPSLRKIFPEDRNFNDISRSITTNLNKTIESLEDLKKINKPVIAEMMKFNVTQMLWKNLEKTYDKFIKNKQKPLAAFKSTVNLAYEIVPDVKALGGANVYSFIDKLKIEDYKKYIELLENLEKKPDWLQELTYVLKFHKAFKNEESDHPDGFIDFFKSALSDQSISDDNKALTFKNINKLYEYCPELIPQMVESLQKSKISDHDKSHSLNTLLYMASQVKVNDQNKASLNSLLEFHKNLPTSSCTANSNSFMALNLSRKLGNKEELKEENFKFAEAYLQLLYEGEFETFKKLITENWQSIDVDHSVTSAFRITPERNESVKQAFELFEDPELKLFARAFYYSTPMVKTKKFDKYTYNSSKSSAPEVSEIAKEFKTLNFKDQKLRSKILLVLSKSNPAALLLQKEISEIISNMAVEDILVKNSSSYWKFYAFYIKQLILKKDFATIDQKLTKLLDIKNNNSKLKNSAQSCASEISNITMKLLTSPAGKEINKEDLINFHPVLDKLVKTVKYDYQTSSLLQALAAREVLEGLEEQALTLASKISQKNLRYIKSRDLNPILKNLPKWYTIDALAKTDLLRLKILKSKPFAKIYKGRSRELKRITKKYSGEKPAVK